MPIVFVHGVATRREQDRGRAYERRVTARTALIRQILAPALGLAPSSVSVLNPYWGDRAARLRWQGASLTTVAERFGGETAIDVLVAEAAVAAGAELPAQRVLLTAAQLYPAAAVDLLWSAAASVEWAADVDVERLASWAGRAVGRAVPGPPAVDDDLALMMTMLAEPAAPPQTETFGGISGAGLLREGVSRIQSSGSRLTSRVAAELLRRRVQQEAAIFMGDVLTYLRQREEHGPEAPIVTTVADGLAAAARTRSETDSQIVVIAHSMGGNIVFDLLSNLRTDLTCDVLVTVGSQVGLFAELGLLPAVADPIAGSAQRRPTGIGRWINVFDPCDVLSFGTAGIFDGTEDFAYSTGRGVLRSHSAYFVRPSFFHQLASRLGDPR